MEQNGSDANIPAAAVSNLCRTGCGFYGNQSFEGMCSKCYKDTLKRKQQSSSPTPNPTAGRLSPITQSHTDVSASSVAEAMCKPSVNNISNTTTPSVATATTTIPTQASSTAVAKEHDKEEVTEGAAAANVSTEETSQQDGEKEKRPKKNRCHTCKKKVGLTGFQCRCGGLYCSMHRYSDKHDCSFNYKEMAQEQIRKNNPVIVSEKIQKI